MSDDRNLTNYVGDEYERLMSMSDVISMLDVYQTLIQEELGSAMETRWVDIREALNEKWQKIYMEAD